MRRSLVPVFVAVGLAAAPLPGGEAEAARRVPPGCDAARPAVFHHAGAVRIDRGDRPVPIPCAFPTGFAAEESTIGITDSGTVFYSPVVDFTDPLASVGLARSRDAGRHWGKVVPKPLGLVPFHFPGDPYVYVDRTTSRIFFVTLHQPAQCGSDISWSDNDGMTWSHTIAGCPLFDHQTLFAGPPRTSEPRGYPNVVYYCALFFVPLQGPADGCAKSLDGGRTFFLTGFPYPIWVTVPNGCDGLTGHGTVGPDGTVYLPKGLCGQPYLAISRDEGRHWDRVQVSTLGLPEAESGEAVHEAGVGVDPAGNVYYSWVAADRLPYLAVSRDGGYHWGKPMMIAPPGVREASLAMITVGGRGRLALSYFGSRNSPGHPPWPEGCRPAADLCLDPGNDDDVTFNGYVTVTANALASKPVFATVSINHPKDPIWRGCSPPACNVSNLTRVDYIDVEIGPDGTPWAALVDACTAECINGTENTPIVGFVGRVWGGPNLLR